MFDRARNMLGVCVTFAFILTGIAQAQDSAYPRVQGAIADAFKQPLDEVEIVVRDSTNRVVITTRTDSDGAYILDGLNPNTPYHFLVRKIGFVADSVTLMTSQLGNAQVGDTLWLDVMLQTNLPKLYPVKVVAKTSNVFDKIDRAFDKIQNALDWFDNTLNKFCVNQRAHGDNFVSLCIDPNGVMFSFAWKPGIGDGPITGGIALASVNKRISAPDTGLTVPQFVLPSQPQGCPVNRFGRPIFAFCKDNIVDEFRDLSRRSVPAASQ